MENKTKKEDSDKWLKEIPLQTDSQSYQTDELIACKKCKRTNPPTRLDCMYCGNELEFDENQSQMLKPVLRKIESHQNGFNLIYLGNLEVWNDEQISEVAKMTRQSNSEIKELFELNKALPIARAETEKETKIVSDRLDEVGIDTRITSDDKFELKTISKRLRRLEFKDETIVLILFNNDEVVEINRKDLALIVIGAMFERKVESTEKYKKKAKSKVLDRAEISSDEVLIDIYTYRDPTGFRILPKGFDFSFLGDEKKLLAIENVKILIKKLKEFAPNAKFDDDYIKVRSKLTGIWEVEEQTDTKGIERKSFGSFNKRSITKTNNLTQFTKYSRLQWHLLSEERSVKS